MARFISYLNSCNCRISSSKEELKETKKETKLVVYYDILDVSSSTIVCSNYGNNMKSMEVDGKLLDSVVKEYQFDSVGEHIIKYEFNDPTSLGHAPLFMSVNTIKRIVIPNTFTTIGASVFNGCSSFTSITIPNSVTSIGEFAFQGCNGLINVTIPDSVTSIGQHAFQDCRSLININIPDSVTSIGEGTFNMCTGLKTITVEAAIPPTAGIRLFANNPSEMKIYVPSESVDAYKTAENWSTYADSIFPIE